jgi:hypothetical protein
MTPALSSPALAGHAPTLRAAYGGALKVANISTAYTEFSGGHYAGLAANVGHGWFIEDGAAGNGVRALRLSDGANRGRWALSGVTTSDAEDMTGYRVNGTPYLIVADCGNNANSANSRGAGIDVSLYRFPEPAITGTDGTVSTGIERIDCVLPAGFTLRDIECVFADQITLKVYLVLKRDATIRLYGLAYAASYSGIQTLTYEGNVSNAAPLNVTSPTSSGNNGYVVGGCMSSNGRLICLVNYRETLIWQRAAGESVPAALARGYDRNLTHADPGGGDAGTTGRGMAGNDFPQRELVFFDEQNNLWMASEYIVAEGGSSTRHPLVKLPRLDFEPTVWTFQEGVSGYAGTLDTYIFSTAPTTDNGAAVSMVADWDGTLGAHTADRECLLKFDISSIPTTKTVVGAYLELYINTEGQGFYLYNMLVTWAESATWGANFGANGITLGTDCGSTPMAELPFTSVGNGLDGYVGSIRVNFNTAAALAIIQGWVTTPATNFGFCIKAHADGDGSQFDTREGATVARRPKITVLTD